MENHMKVDGLGVPPLTWGNRHIALLESKPQVILTSFEQGRRLAKPPGSWLLNIAWYHWENNTDRMGLEWGITVGWLD